MNFSRSPLAPLLPFLFLATAVVLLTACGLFSDEATPLSDADFSDQATMTSETLPPLLLHRLPRQEADTLQRITPPTGDPETLYIAENSDLSSVLSDETIFLADRILARNLSYFALPEGWPAPNGLWHARCEANSLRVRPINSVQDVLLASGCAPLWSPHGRVLAYATPDGLYAAPFDPTADTPPAPEQFASGPDYTPLAWSPDETTLLYKQDGDVFVQPIGGQAQQLALDGRELDEAIWAEDGRRLYLRYGRGETITTLDGHDVPLTGLALYDLSQNERYTLSEPDSDTEGALAFALSPGGSTLAVWHAVCEWVLSQVLPVRVLECTSQLRFIPVTDPANWTSVGASHTSRSPTIPILRWADWQTNAAQLPVPPTTAVSVPSPPTLPTPAGQTPVPLGDVIQQEAYRYQVLEVLRGGQATQFIRNGAIGSQVEPPAPGYEYMVVKLAVEHVEGDLIELGVSFFPALLGQNLSGQTHLFYLDGANGRERRSIVDEGRVEAWLPFLIAADDPHPVLYLPPSYPRTAPIYLAVTPDSPGLPTTPPRTAVAANSNGLVAPAVDSLISTRDWQIQVNNVLRGDEIANVRWLAEAVPNFYFEAGQNDIIAASITATYQGGDTPICTRHALRVLTFGGQAGLPQELEPGFARHGFTCYMPGGTHTGWVFMQAEPDNPLPALKFIPAPTDPIGSRLLGLVSASDAPEIDVGEHNEQALRDQPTPRGDTAVADNIRYTIADTLRGADALAYAQESWANTSAPPAGYNYVLIKLRIENENTYDIETPPLGLTGSQGALYRPNSLLVRPLLPRDVPAQSDVEGWRAFVVPETETNLVLVVPAPFDNDMRFSQFLALTDEGGPTATLLPNPPATNDAGMSITSSAPRNTAVVTADWQVRVLDSVRGPEALARLQTANSHNAPPAEGYEYVLALVEITRNTGDPHQLYSVTGSYLFEWVNEADTAVESPVLVKPAPTLDGALFAGGTRQGWLAGQALVGEPLWLRFVDPNQVARQPRYLAIDE